MSNKIENKKDTGSLKLIFGWLYRYWRSHKLKLLVLMIMTMVYTALAISYPIFFKMVVDGLINKLPAHQLNRYVLYPFATGGRSGPGQLDTDVHPGLDQHEYRGRIQEQHLRQPHQAGPVNPVLLPDRRRGHPV